MPSQWYFMKGEEKCGPVRSKVLRALAESGQLKKTDLVWKEGLPKWKPASGIKGLFLDSDGVGAKDASGSNFDPDIITSSGTAILVSRIAGVICCLFGSKLGISGIPYAESLSFRSNWLGGGLVIFGFGLLGKASLARRRTKQLEKMAGFRPVRCNSCCNVGRLGIGDNFRFGSEWDFDRVCKKCGSEDWRWITEGDSSPQIKA